MKMFSKSTFLAGVTAALLGFSVSAAAVAPSGFTGDYAVGNWTQVPLPPPVLNQGSIDLVGAPDLVTLVGWNDSSGLANLTSFTIAASSAATVSFDWHYVTADLDPFWDKAYFVNGIVQTKLPTDGTGTGGVPLDQSGSGSFSVGAGQTFGFSVASLDGFGGAAQLTISNFNVVPTSPVPEPGSFAMLTAGLLVVVAARKRKQC